MLRHVRVMSCLAVAWQSLGSCLAVAVDEIFGFWANNDP